MADPIISSSATTDTPEIEALAARAASLRERYLAAMRSDARVEALEVASQAGRRAVDAGHALESAELQLQMNRDKVAELRAEVDELEAEARFLEEEMVDPIDPIELREKADGRRATIEVYETVAERTVQDVAQRRAALDSAEAELDTASQRLEIAEDRRAASEGMIDEVETKLSLLRDEQDSLATASDNDARAVELRADGKISEAEQLEGAAERYRISAAATRERAEAIVIDEQVLEAGLDPSATNSVTATVDGVPAEPSGTGPAVPEADTAPVAPPAPTSPPQPEPTAAVSPGDEATALEVRATDLRAELLRQARSDRATEANELVRVTREEAMAKAGAESSAESARHHAERATTALDQAREEERLAADAGLDGKPELAREHRENADMWSAAAAQARLVSDTARDDALRLGGEANDHAADRTAREAAWEEGKADLHQAEREIDTMEQRVEVLRAAERDQNKANRLERRAESLREQGDTEGADAASRSSAEWREQAAVRFAEADELIVDETHLGVLGLEEVAPVTVEPAGAVAALSLDDAEAAELEAHAVSLRAALEREMVDGAVLNVRAAILQERANAAEAAADYDADLPAAADWSDGERRALAQADRAAAEGRTDDATELRENARIFGATAERLRQVGELGREEAERLEDVATTARTEADIAYRAYSEYRGQLKSVENAVDAVENRAARLREAETSEAQATALEAEAVALRSSGSDDEADRRLEVAAGLRTVAAAQRLDAANIVIDQQALITAQLLAAPVGAGVDADPAPSVDTAFDDLVGQVDGQLDDPTEPDGEASPGGDSLLDEDSIFSEDSVFGEDPDVSEDPTDDPEPFGSEDADDTFSFEVPDADAMVADIDHQLFGTDGSPDDNLPFVASTTPADDLVSDDDLLDEPSDPANEIA